MKVAFVGKGGAGKSTIAGTLARILAARGRPVLVADSDPMPGLAFSIGFPATDAPIPDDAVDQSPEGSDGPRYRLRGGLSAAQAVELYALVGPDGIRLLQFGKLGGGAVDLARSQFAYREILNKLPAGMWDVIGDLPGGTRQPFYRWGSFADVLVLVVEPTAKSLLSGRRLARLAGMEVGQRVVAVANRVCGPDDVALVGRRTGLEVIGSIPWDDRIAEADRSGIAPADLAPDAPAVRAVGLLADRLDEVAV